jgi:hypothetical protein
MAAAIARQVVLEFDIEQPVHAFHAPVITGAVGEPVDIERGGRDVKARLERAALGILGARVDLE